MPMLFLISITINIFIYILDAQGGSIYFAEKGINSPQIIIIIIINSLFCLHHFRHADTHDSTADYFRLVSRQK